MYWCLMACPGLTSGHSREIIEVPFKSFPHWKPLTELQEDICNVTILKCSVIAIQNDMKTEYEQLRPISPIKIRLNKNDVCTLIFATPGLACLSTIKGAPEVPQLHEGSVERSGTKRYRWQTQTQIQTQQHRETQTQRIGTKRYRWDKDKHTHRLSHIVILYNCGSKRYRWDKYKQRQSIIVTQNGSRDKKYKHNNADEHNIKLLKVARVQVIAW